MNLRHRQMWMLAMHLFRAPSIGQLVEHNFDDLGVCATDPRDTLLIDLD